MRLIVAIGIALVVACPAARAQSDAKAPRLPDSLTVLGQSQNQKELGLTREQAEAVEKLTDEWREVAALDENLWAAKRAFSKRALELLTEPQRRPFLEMVLQNDLATGTTPLFWLRFPPAQAELGLTAEQKMAIEELQSEWVDKALPELRTLEPAGPPHFPWLTQEVAVKRAELEREFQPRMKARLEQALTPAQLRRFDEITLQSESRNQGPRIFLDPGIVRELRLTADQQEEIRNTVIALRQEDAAANFKDTMQRQREGIQTIVAPILTPEQQARWTALLGEPFPWTMQPRIDGNPSSRE